jgi:hypothetical protein
MKSRTLRAALVVVAVCAGGILAYFAATAGAAILGPPALSPTPNSGQAASRFGPVGFKVQVVGRSDAAGTLQVRLVFRNESSQQQRADPADFVLEGPRGYAAAPVFGPGCPDWGRVDLYPPGDTATQPLRDAGGTAAPAVWGPSTLCFAGAPPAGLTLVWSPDVAFGPLGQDTRIPLT